MERFLAIFASFLVNLGPILGRFHAIASKVPNLEIPKNARVSPVFTWFFINFRSFHLVSVSDTISVRTTSLKQGRHLFFPGVSSKLHVCLLQILELIPLLLSFKSAAPPCGGHGVLDKDCRSITIADANFCKTSNFRQNLAYIRIGDS